MKNRTNVLRMRQFGIIALISLAIVTLSFTGCWNGTTKSYNGGGGSANTRALTFSNQQVWSNVGASEYEKEDEDLGINGPSYATGSVVKGKLSFTLNEPADLQDLAASLRSSLLNVMKVLTFSGEDNPAYTITAPQGACLNGNRRTMCVYLRK